MCTKEGIGARKAHLKAMYRLPRAAAIVEGGSLGVQHWAEEMGRVGCNRARRGRRSYDNGGWEGEKTAMGRSGGKFKEEYI